MKRSLLFRTLLFAVIFIFCGSNLKALTRPLKIPPQGLSEQSETAFQPISKLPTDIAGMVGAAEKGPVSGSPVPVTDFTQFQRIFGGFAGSDSQQPYYLAYAVRGFFENGGQKLYIERVTGKSPGITPAPADYIGRDNGRGCRTGIQALADIDEIGIVAVPGITDPLVLNALLRHCEQAGDRFAILDAPLSSGPNEAVSFRSQCDSPNGALYYPWLVITDPITNGTLDIPPSGHLAGIYARKDRQAGVHKAPANEPINGINGFNRQVSATDREELNYRAINPLIYFNGRGNMVWGAKTLSADPEWKYINVRRLCLMVKESVAKGTGWVAKEPNNERLWAKVKTNVEEFLRRLWIEGALLGSKPDQAFFVKADRTTMTTQDIHDGKLIIEVGVAPVKPAEFIIMRIVQKTGSGR